MANIVVQEGVVTQFRTKSNVPGRIELGRECEGSGFAGCEASNREALDPGVVDEEIDVSALLGAPPGVANEGREARQAGLPERSRGIVQAFNCEIILPFSDCRNDEDVGIFLKVFERVAGRGWELRPIHFLRICDEEHFLARGLQLGHELVKKLYIGLKVQGIWSCTFSAFFNRWIDCIEDGFDLNGVISRSPEKDLGTAAHEHNAYRVSFLCCFENISRFCYSAFEAGLLAVVHAVGSVNSDNHADSFLSDDRFGVESDPHQSEGEEREDEATQDQNEEVLNLDLT